MAGIIEDFIRHHQASNASLFSNNAKAHVSCAIPGILQMYTIHDFRMWATPYQHKDPTSRKIQFKKVSNKLLDSTG